MYCTNCGTQNPDDNIFCIGCGAMLAAQQDTIEKPKNPQRETPRSSAPKQPQKKPKKKSQAAKVRGIMRAVIIAAVIFAAALVILALFDPFGWLGKKEDTADKNSVFADVSQDDLLYTYARREIGLMQEMLRLQYDISGESADSENMMAALMQIEEPASVQRLDFKNLDDVWQEQLAQAAGKAAENETVASYLRNSPVSSLTSYLMAQNINEAGVPAMAASLSLRSGGFVYDGLEAPAALVLTYPNDAVIFASFIPSDEDTVGMSVLPVFGTAGGQISEDPVGYFQDNSMFQGAPADSISVRNLEDPQRLEKIPEVQTGTYESETIAREMTEHLLNDLLDTGFFTLLYDQDDEAKWLMKEYADAPHEIRNIYVFDLDTSSPELLESLSEEGVDLSACSPELREWVYQMFMRNVQYSNAADMESEDYTLQSICQYGKNYAGRLIYFTTKPVTVPQACIVDCGEEIPPVLVFLAGNDEDGVISATAVLCSGRTLEDLYTVYEGIADCPVPLSSSDTQEEYDGPQFGTGTAIATPEPAQEAEPAPTEEPAPAVEDAGVETVDFEHKYENGKEYGVITGRNAAGDAVWSLQTGQYDAAQLDQVGNLGRSLNDYFYYEAGSVICVDFQTGQPRWVNTEFSGASADADIMDNGYMYLCGYFGPALMEIDENGKTVNRIDDFSGYMWYWGIDKIGGDELLLNCTQEDSTMKEVTLHIETVDYSIIYTE